MSTSQENYSELSFYTLAHPDPAFIHQHIVDANIAQNADENTKPISLIFALVGLYLYLEKAYTGRAVQNAHSQLAKQKPTWPQLTLPESRGKIGVSDVLAAPAGAARDAMIHTWAASVWAAYENCHEQIIAFVKTYLVEFQEKG